MGGKPLVPPLFPPVAESRGPPPPRPERAISGGSGFLFRFFFFPLPAAAATELGKVSASRSSRPPVSCP